MKKAALGLAMILVSSVGLSAPINSVAAKKTAANKKTQQTKSTTSKYSEDELLDMINNYFVSISVNTAPAYTMDYQDDGTIIFNFYRFFQGDSELWYTVQIDPATGDGYRDNDKKVIHFADYSDTKKANTGNTKESTKSNKSSGNKSSNSKKTTNNKKTSQNIKQFKDNTLVKAIYKEGDFDQKLRDDLDANPKKYLSELNGTCWKISPSYSVPYAINASFQSRSDQIDFSGSIDQENDYLNRMYGWALSQQPNVPVYAMTDPSTTCAYIKLENMDKLEYGGVSGYDSYDSYDLEQFTAMGDELPLAQFVGSFNGNSVTIELSTLTSANLVLNADFLEDLKPTDSIDLNFELGGFTAFMSSVDPDIDLDQEVVEMNDLNNMLGPTSSIEDFSDYEKAVEDFNKKYDSDVINDTAYQLLYSYTSVGYLTPVSNEEYDAVYKEAINLDDLSEQEAESPNIFMNSFVQSFFYSVAETLKDNLENAENPSDILDNCEYFLLDTNDDHVPEVYWKQKDENEWYMYNCVHSFYSSKYSVNDTPLDDLDQVITEAGLPKYDMSDTSGFQILYDHMKDNGLIDTSVDYNILIAKSLEQTEEKNNEQKTQKSKEILPNSSKKKLTEKDIKGLNKDQLQTAINEIYARKGYAFKDKNIRAYFEQFSWYKPTISPSDFSDDMWTAVEKYNIDFLNAHIK